MPATTTAYSLTDKVDILSLGLSGSRYAWTASSAAWAQAERTDRISVFSTMGVGRRAVRFTVRARALTLLNAIRWNGQHCFITDIDATKARGWMEITAALIEPTVCSVTREKTEVDELKRPVRTVSSTLEFPGCLTERFQGQTQELPTAVEESSFVLVTPKVIELKAGELVTVGGAPYTVVLTQTLEAHRNEYEIRREADI
jgi:hypothetical protein